MEKMIYSSRNLILPMFRISLCCAALLLALTGLASCGSSALLSNVTISDTTLQPTGNGDHVDISYTVGQKAKVSVYLQDDNGTRYILRDGELRQPSSEPYTLRFDGTAPTDDPILKRKALPSGTYTYIVQASPDDGGQPQTAQGKITIQAGDIKPPLVENLVVFPGTISPNADAIDDVAEITYRLPVTATVDITFTAPDGVSYPFVTAAEEGPFLQKHVWNGKTVDNTLLADGVYTYTVSAQDRFGNLVERQGRIGVKGGGQPEVKITYSNIAPEAIIRGDVITVTMQVKNIGKVPIRTYGPAPGYEYSTEEVFSSVEGGKYAVKPGGFWRIGVDWDANSGGAAKRYPYRWAITPRPPEQWKIPYQEDLLMPGEEAQVTGRIRVFQPETKMGFYVGLIQDGVGFFQDKTGRTIVEVGF
jgi:hypothetical protein